MGGSAARHEFTAPIRLTSMVSFHTFGRWREAPDGPLHARRGHQPSSVPNSARNALHRSRHLLQVAHIGAEAQGNASGLSISSWRGPARSGSRQYPTRAPAWKPMANRFQRPGRRR